MNVIKLFEWLNWKLGKIVKPIKLSYLKKQFASCGDGLEVYGKPKISFPSRIKLGHNVSLNDGCVLNATESSIEIGNYCTISSYAQILGATYNVEDYLYNQNKCHISKPVVIGDNVWVCASAIICPGVRIWGG